MSRCSNVALAPPIEVFALTKAYAEDSFEKKVNLGVGAYRTDQGQPWVLPVIRTTEKILAQDDTLNKEYLPVLGLESFTAAATQMLLGEDSLALKENRAFGVQTLSGTGGLRVVAEFLAKTLGYKYFYYSNPTWASVKQILETIIVLKPDETQGSTGNHKLIFKNAGFAEGREYRYWSETKRGLDLEGMLEDLNNAPENSVIILHACAHNPTGCDPTQDEWKKIADVIEKRKLFPLFDSAYQGFASGDLEKDAWAVRYFASRNFEFMCTQSFAKNFGLYNERVGNLTVVLNDPSVIPHVKSQLTLIIRGMYSNPPSHGARLISYILNNPKLYDQWKQHIKEMSSRIIEMRKALRNALEKFGTPGNWSHITSQIGMFSYTGLNEKQSVHMVEKYHIYMLKSGRISMCGLTPQNVEYVAKSICDTITQVQ